MEQVHLRHRRHRANAPYKVTFARFTYGPPLVQAAASGDIDLGVVGDVPPITGAAKEYGFSVVGMAHYAGLTPSDVQVDFLSPAAGATAFASGKVIAQISQNVLPASYNGLHVPGL